MATTTTYSTVGTFTFTAPADGTSIQVECWGAQGGAENLNGGLGGYAKSILTMTPGATLTINVGGRAIADAGGSGGGGSANSGYGGGGASDVRQGGVALANRVCVGGGGGGPGFNTSPGGAGGGTSGLAAGGEVGYGKGGTQSAGGAGGVGGGAGGQNGGAGSLGQGGSANFGGGGGGYYGGGAGGYLGNDGTSVGTYYSGGGGSSFFTGGGSTTSGVQPGVGKVVVTQLNVTPNAPTLVSPVGAVTIDRTVTQRLSWTFSDPDAGDSQSKADVRYRVVGSPTFTDAASVSPSQFYDVAPSTFAAANYEWQVRTYDAIGIVGPYSASGFFTAATPPVGPTIIEPINGSTIATSTSTMAWSYPTQQAYRVRRVADNAGVANPSTIYFDSGLIVSTSVRQLALTFDVNNRSEHLQVLVQDGGLLSPYSSVRIMVSFTPPAAPTLALTVSYSTASIAVAITNPTPSAGQPTVTSHDLYRREGGVGDGIRIAKTLLAGSTFTDRTVASGVDYSYRAVSTATNGTTSTSVWKTSASGYPPGTLGTYTDTYAVSY